MSETTKARYSHDGESLNLAAAASDAYSWLFLALHEPETLCSLTIETKGRLAACLRRLDEEVTPCLPEIWEPEPRKFPDAVAVIYSQRETQEETA